VTPRSRDVANAVRAGFDRQGVMAHPGARLVTDEAARAPRVTALPFADHTAS
jgi:hypothetical protein